MFFLIAGVKRLRDSTCIDVPVKVAFLALLRVRLTYLNTFVGGVRIVMLASLPESTPMLRASKLLSMSIFRQDGFFNPRLAEDFGRILTCRYVYVYNEC